MEAYAVAQFCKMYDIPFYCLKAVSDNLDGNLKDWQIHPFVAHNALADAEACAAIALKLL